MSTLGEFAFEGMIIEVESLRSDSLGCEIFWLHRTAPEPRATIAIRRPNGLAVTNDAATDPTRLEAALSEFLKGRSDRL